MAKERQQTQTKAPEKTSKRKKEFKKKREKRIVPHGVAHIQATFNNTIITICGPDGRTVSWSSAGSIGFKGSRKGTPYAAQQASGIRRGRGARPVRHEIDRSAREGAGLGPRVGRARAGFVGPAHRAHQGRDADSAQRLPSAQAPPRLIRLSRLARSGICSETGLLQERFGFENSNIRRNEFGTSS